MTEAEIKQAVKEAVSEALRGANLVDGPTHIAHHQALEGLLQAKQEAYKVGVRTVVVGFIGLVVLGIATWVREQVFK